jgi:hypothetical protein
MLENFQLAAIVKQGSQTRLLRIPMHQALQDELARLPGTHSTKPSLMISMK